MNAAAADSAPGPVRVRKLRDPLTKCLRVWNSTAVGA